MNQLFICCRCNAKYTLPIPYEDCNPVYRDICPSCMPEVYIEQVEKINEKEKEMKEILKRELERCRIT